MVDALCFFENIPEHFLKTNATKRSQLEPQGIKQASL